VTREKLELIADEYYEQTGRVLYVTSGSRTPKRQAAAMYDNFINNRNQIPPYKDRRSFNEIKAIYEMGREQHWSKNKTVDKMTSVIQKQIAHGRYISRHLRGNGVDVRIRDMSQDQRQAFEDAVDHVLHVDIHGKHHWFHETDHYHVQF
jgi:hypothetical protein